MIDKQSETWRHVEEWSKREREICRDQLEQPGLEPGDTEFVRGRIAALNELRNLVAEKPAIRSAPVIT